MRFGLPRASLSKGNYSAGPKASHKYWRRVRVMAKGRLSWRYYYNNAKDRAQYLEDRKKKRHRGKHEKLAHLHEDEVLALLHVDKDSWAEHFSEFRRPRVPARELTAEGIFGRIGWKNPPEISFDAGAYAIANELLTQDEPDDLYGKAMHPLRAVEAAAKLLPAEIVARFDGTIKTIDFYGTRKDAVKATGAKGVGKAGAWAYPHDGRTVFPLNTVAITSDASRQAVADVTISGANAAVGIFLHEWAHHFAAHMGDGGMRNDGGEPNWADWVKLSKQFSKEKSRKIESADKKGKRGGEKGITAYAMQDISERFSETFSAALLTPVQLAHECPLAYDFMHRLMPSAVPPRAELVALAFPKDAVAKFVDPWFMADPVVETTAQKLVADLPMPQTAAESYTLDPADPDKIGKQGSADRFYEMNYRGRTVFFRHGKKNADDASEGSKWEPATEDRAVKQRQPALDNIKECYDEHGNPLNPAFAYWHLVQDVLPDDAVLSTPTVKVKGQKVSKPITMEYVREHGGIESDDPWIDAVFGRSNGTHRLNMVLRSFSATKVHTGLTEIRELHAKRDRLSPADEEYGKLSAAIDTLHRKIESDADRSGAKARAAGESYLPMPVSMLPHEVTATHYRQTSGAFNYDRWGHVGEDLLERLRSAQPGSTAEANILNRIKNDHPGLLRLKPSRLRAGSKAPKRDKKGAMIYEADGVTPVMTGAGGRWDEFSPFFESVNGRRQPALAKYIYENENPDGSKTRIEAIRGDDGRFRLNNPMWAALLTPNGEEIASEEHLETLCRTAARNRHKAWISIKTDRQRTTVNGKVAVDAPGDLAHNIHLEVEFDGAGQPRILGEPWKKRLGDPNPRLDQLLEHDDLGAKVAWAQDRLIIPADPVMYTDEITKRPALPSQVGDRVLLTTRKLDWKTKADLSGREVVAKLLRKIPGKKAGEMAAAPGWDRMPEGEPLLEREIPAGIAGKMSPKMKTLIAKGLLPAWYKHTPTQAEWYRNHFIPTYASWEKNLETSKMEEYDPVYIFSGEVGLGGGSNLFRRVGDKDVADTFVWAEASPSPAPLSTSVLAHHHKTIDPRNGATIASEIRLYPPTDGSTNASQLEAMVGVTTHYDDDESDVPTRFTTTLDQFPKVRASLGGLSITGGVSELLDKRNAMLKAAERQRLSEAHELQLDQITPEWMIKNFGAGLNEYLPDGSKFKLARHQSEGLQKLFDNDLRVLLAHYMGTGKTVTALTACKMAMARPRREGVDSGKGIPTDLVGADRERWLSEHPFIPGTLDPRNPKRCLIVAPLNTVEQWRQAATDFDDGALVVGAGANDIPIDQLVAGIMGDKKSPHYRGPIDPDIVVVGPQYYTIHSDKLKKCGFDGLVIDEVHQGIKNEAAERNKVVNEWNPDMKMMLLLTGTPMTTSPADFVEYVRLLSNNAQWATMDKKSFADEFLMKTPIPGLTGTAVSAPKIAIKPEKRAEFAAILAQWMNIALPKHVAGKILPMVGIADTASATMTGTQMDIYNLYMGVLNAHGITGGLTEEEAQRLGGEARRAANSAKGVMNCVGFKPGGEDPFITVHVELEAGAAPAKQKWRPPNPEALFDKDHRKKNAGKWPLPGELHGGAQAADLLNLHFQEVLGMPYSELAGKPIGWGVPVPGLADPYKAKPSAKQIAEAKRRMTVAGWPLPVPNPDAGPLGLRFRGTSELWNAKLSDQILKADAAGKTKQAAALRAQLRERGAQLLEAQEFQRAYRHALEFPETVVISKQEAKITSPERLLEIVAEDWEVDLDDARALLAMVPNPSFHSDVLRLNDPDFGEVELRSSRLNADGRPDPSLGDQYVSDVRGSLHLLYRKEDLGEDGLPKSPKNSTFEDVQSGEVVKVPEAALKKAGIKRPTKRPEGMTVEAFKEFRTNWAPPVLRYDATIGEDKKGRVGLISEGPPMETIYVAKKDIQAQVKSLMDPGMRKDRFKADLMMTTGNAKTDAVGEYIERFHDGSGPGTDGERQIVLFANEILTGCRTLEAKLRLMGYADVNEALVGSVQHDPADPRTKGGTSPNGKYFVTYIGATYTGDREQNTLIFKKVKDSRGRDSKTSLFVQNLLEPRVADRIKTKAGAIFVDWKVYAGDHGDNHLPPGVSAVQMSTLSPEQRATAKHTLGIDAPESYVMRENGKSSEKAYFYGANFADFPGGSKTRSSLLEAYSTKDAKGNYTDKLTSTQDLLTMIARSSDPTKIEDPLEAKAAVARIAGLKKAYSLIAAARATMDPPIDDKQITVFNNCEIIVCSDAAQVGMNLGNASELGAYDSLGSPMAEWQRYTRCARMLPEAVPEKLMGKPIMEVVKVTERDAAGQIIMTTDKKGKSVPSMIPKKVLDAETGKLVTVKAQKRDKRGRFLYSTTGKNQGLFDALRSAETSLFQPENRQMPVGTLRGLQVHTGHAGITSDNKRLAKKTLPVMDALSAIAERASNMAAITEGPLQRQWDAIVSKSELAVNQGGLAAIAQLEAFKDSKAPGTTESLISYPETGLVRPDYDEGTYDAGGLLDTADVEKVITAWFDKLNDIDRKLIMDAGFIQAEPPAVGSFDPKEVYLAMRSQEILMWVDSMRPVVSDGMRKGEGGDAITDEEVTNRLLAMLSPTDRAILKTKKYLVNVHKFGAGGAVGQVSRYKHKEVTAGEDGKPKTETVISTIHTGYEQEALVATDVRTRTMGRGRTVSNEQIMTDVQTGVEFRADSDFEQVATHQVASIAALKSLTLFFDLSKRLPGDNPIVAKIKEPEIRKSVVFGLPFGGE